MSIKDSAENLGSGRARAGMILVAAVGIVIGGVVGLGAGFKIEQNRTRSDVKKLAGAAATGRRAPAAPRRAPRHRSASASAR